MTPRSAGSILHPTSAAARSHSLSASSAWPSPTPSLQLPLPITPTFPQHCRHLATAAVVVPPTCRSQMPAATLQRYTACDGQRTVRPRLLRLLERALHCARARCAAKPCWLPASRSIAVTTRRAVRRCPRSQVKVLCGAAGMDDDCCSPEAQGRGRSRKIESGRLPQFRIPVQTGAVAKDRHARV